LLKFFNLCAVMLIPDRTLFVSELLVDRPTEFLNTSKTLWCSLGTFELKSAMTSVQ
jgi:hypothetical protein